MGTEMLHHPCQILVAGPQQAGKSHFVKTLVEHRMNMIFPQPKHVYWCYTMDKPDYPSLLSDPGVTFVRGFPDFANMRDVLIIFDDMMIESKNNEAMITSLATRGCHHRLLSLVHITQNAFYGGRTTRINSNYLVLMKNPSDKLQIAMLARQLFPDNAKYFKEAYEDATSNAHGYLFVDLHQTTPEHIRLRTCIFPGQNTVVYTPINKNAWNFVGQ